MHSAFLFTDPRPSPFLCGVRSITIAAITLSIVGCRSGRPSGSMVQITEDPSAIVADLPAPEQRLATTTTSGKRTTDKHSIGNEQAVDLVSAADGMPEIFREKPVAGFSPTNPVTADSKTQLSLSDSDTPRQSKAKSSTQSPVAETLVHQTAPTSSPTQKVTTTTTSTTSPATEKTVGSSPPSEQDETAQPTPESVAKAEVEVTSGGLVSASLTDLTDPEESKQEIAAKVATASSEQTAVALPIEGPRSSASASGIDLVASKTGRRPPVRRSSIKQTDQPQGLSQALQQSLSGLPSLPNVKPESGGALPTRIGTGETESESSTTHVGDFVTQNDATSSADQPVEFEEEGNIVMNANQVRPASHDSSNDAVDFSDRLQPSSIETSPTELSKVELSDAQLYGALLDRISRAAPDESPTERERRLIIARHLMVLAGDPTSAVSTLDGLNETEQLYMKHQLMGLWTMINPDGHPSSGRRVTEALPKFREATRYMAAATDSLELRSLEFCTEIESYGQIKPFPGNRFSSGQQVILYCEVENFAAADREGHFQTQLQGSYDIYDASGRKVISQLLPVDQQRSRNRLRDYFVAYQMNLPKALPTGTYRLQLTIEDVVGKKYGQQDIPFEIR